MIWLPQRLVTARCSPVPGEAKVHEAGQHARPGGFLKQFDIGYERRGLCRIERPEIHLKVNAIAQKLSEVVILRL